MEGVVYTREELGGMVRPLLEKYGMESASLFGSYARGEADASPPFCSIGACLGAQIRIQ